MVGGRRWCGLMSLPMPQARLPDSGNKDPFKGMKVITDIYSQKEGQALLSAGQGTRLEEAGQGVVVVQQDQGVVVVQQGKGSGFFSPS